VIRKAPCADANDEIVQRDIGRAVARIVIDEHHGTGRDRLTPVARKITALSNPAVAAAAE
jgi:hypothetical protein